MDSNIRTVPWPIAWAVLVVLAVGVWYSGRALQARVDARLATESRTVMPAKPAHGSLANK